MPKALEQQLFEEGRKRGLTGEHLNAYVYGTLRNQGWSPEHKDEPTYEVNSRIRPYGDYNTRTGHIRINPRRGDVVNTIIHERLHHDFPDMEHEKVYETAAKIESKMTLPEMAIELLNVHQRSMDSPQEDKITHTTASKVIKSESG